LGRNRGIVLIFVINLFAGKSLNFRRLFRVFLVSYLYSYLLFIEPFINHSFKSQLSLYTKNLKMKRHGDEQTQLVLSEKRQKHEIYSLDVIPKDDDNNDDDDEQNGRNTMEDSQERRL